MPGANTDRQARVVTWLQAHPGDWTLKEILRGIGEPHDGDAAARSSGIVTSLAKQGKITGVQVNSRLKKWRYGGNPNVLAVSAEPALVSDPWGDEISEQEAQGIVKRALAFYFDHLADSRAKDAKRRLKRELFICGAFMSGRPLPSPAAPVIVNNSASPAAISEPGGPPGKSLPKGWTTDTLAKKLGSAVKRGATTYQSVADKVGLAEDHVRRYGNGTAYMTPDKAEQIYAVVADVL